MNFLKHVNIMSLCLFVFGSVDGAANTAWRHEPYGARAAKITKEALVANSSYHETLPSADTEPTRVRPVAIVPPLNFSSLVRSERSSVPVAPQSSPSSSIMDASLSSLNSCDGVHKASSIDVPTQSAVAVDLLTHQRPKEKDFSSSVVAACASQEPGTDARVRTLQQQLSQRDKEIQRLQAKLQQRSEARRTLEDLARERALFLKERNDLVVQKKQLEEKMSQCRQDLSATNSKLDSLRNDFARLGHLKRQEKERSLALEQCLQKWQQYANERQDHCARVEQRLSEVSLYLNQYQHLAATRPASSCGCREVTWITGALLGVWTVFAHWDLYTHCQK